MLCIWILERPSTQSHIMNSYTNSGPLEITDSMWSWFRAYLSGRMQCVYINSALSDFLPVFLWCAPRQYSWSVAVLNIYEWPSSFCHIFKVTPFCWWCQVFHVHNIPCWLLCSTERSKTILLSGVPPGILPSIKINTLLFNFKQKNGFDYLIGKSVNKNFTQDLGVFISATLQWKCHYQHILSKSYKMLGLLRRTFSEIHCSRAKRILYLSLIRSQLLYCSPLWRPHLLSDIKCLEDVQRRSTKFILRDSSLSYRDRLLKLNLLPLMMEFEISDIISLLNLLNSHQSILGFRTSSLLVLRIPDLLLILNSDTLLPRTMLFIIVISTVYRDCGTLSHALILISQFQQ